MLVKMHVRQKTFAYVTLSELDSKNNLNSKTE